MLFIASAFVGAIFAPATALALPATIYVDANSDGSFDSGEEDNTFINGTGGATYDFAFDVDLPGNPSTSEVVVVFDYIDNSFQLAINGSHVCAPIICELQASASTAGTFSFLEFATGIFSTPWLANTNGLPRLIVTISEAGISMVGTRTTTSTSLETIIFSTGGTGAPPTFVEGQNTIFVNNIDGPGPDGISGTITGSFDNYIPGVTIGKNANVASVSAAGSTIIYTIPVQNTGNYLISSATVTDSITSVTCPSSGTNVVLNLAVGATENCTANYTVLQSDMDTNGGGDGDIDNTINISGTSATFLVSASQSETVTIVQNPSIIVSKVASPNVNVSAGQTVNYTYEVRNNGNLTISDISMVDVHGGSGAAPIPQNETLVNDSPPFGDSTDGTSDFVWDSLAPGDTVRFTGFYIVTQNDVDTLQ